MGKKDWIWVTLACCVNVDKDGQRDTEREREGISG